MLGETTTKYWIKKSVEVFPSNEFRDIRLFNAKYSKFYREWRRCIHRPSVWPIPNRILSFNKLWRFLNIFKPETIFLSFRWRNNRSQHKFLTKELHQLNEHYTHEQNILDTTLNVYVNPSSFLNFLPYFHVNLPTSLTIFQTDNTFHQSFNELLLNSIDFISITEELEEKRDKFHRLRNRQCDISYPPSLILEHYGKETTIKLLLTY